MPLMIWLHILTSRKTTPTSREILVRDSPALLGTPPATVKIGGVLHPSIGLQLMESTSRYDTIPALFVEEDHGGSLIGIRLISLVSKKIDPKDRRETARNVLSHEGARRPLSAWRTTPRNGHSAEAGGNISPAVSGAGSSTTHSIVVFQ